MDVLLAALCMWSGQASHPKVLVITVQDKVLFNFTQRHTLTQAARQRKSCIFSDNKKVGSIRNGNLVVRQYTLYMH